MGKSFASFKPLKNPQNVYYLYDLLFSEHQGGIYNTDSKSVSLQVYKINFTNTCNSNMHPALFHHILCIVPMLDALKRVSSCCHQFNTFISASHNSLQIFILSSTRFFWAETTYTSVSVVLVLTFEAFRKISTKIYKHLSKK